MTEEARKTDKWEQKPYFELISLRCGIRDTAFITHTSAHFHTTLNPRLPSLALNRALV
jgi:hypothetical protein